MRIRNGARAEHNAAGHPDITSRSLTLGRTELYDLAGAVLGRGAPFTFVARGVSMLPFVRGGDQLTIVPCSGQALRRGDIAFYSPESDRLLAHRVIGRSRDGVTLLIRGDALWRVPERIDPTRVLGRVAYLERGGKGRRRLNCGRRLMATLWHGLFPLPLWIYLKVCRLRRADPPSA